MIDNAFDLGDEDGSESQIVLATGTRTEWINVERIAAKRVFVGAGARFLFYPTLLYNVVRNKLETEFRWWDPIEQFVLLGAVPFRTDVPRLRAIGVRAVVTLNESYETLVPSSMYEDDGPLQKHGIDHLVIPTRDYLFAPSLGDIRRAVKFIHCHAQRGETTYVHCKAGRGRSTTVVLCYLVEYKGMTPIDAYQYVRAKRPRVLLATAQWQAVQEYSKQVSRQLVINNFVASPLEMLSFPQNQAAIQHILSVPSLTKYEEGEQNEVGSSCNLEELPVVISSVDLAGYRGIQDAGMIGNDLWEDLGVAYRVRFIAARSVVNAVGVARASVAWARLSCFYLGCQAENGRVLGTHAHLTVKNFSSSDVISCTNSMAVPVSIAEQIAMARLSLPVCQSGMVSG